MEQADPTALVLASTTGQCAGDGSAEGLPHPRRAEDVRNVEGIPRKKRERPRLTYRREVKLHGVRAGALGLTHPDVSDGGSEH